MKENYIRCANSMAYIKNGKILDVGCAKGFLLDEFIKYGFNTFGIELSLKNVKIANKKVIKYFMVILKNFMLIILTNMTS